MHLENKCWLYFLYITHYYISPKFHSSDYTYFVTNLTNAVLISTCFIFFLIVLYGVNCATVACILQIYFCKIIQLPYKLQNFIFCKYYLEEKLRFRDKILFFCKSAFAKFGMMFYNCRGDL